MKNGQDANIQIEYGKELGRLLSYSDERIHAMIESYFS